MCQLPLGVHGLPHQRVELAGLRRRLERVEPPLELPQCLPGLLQLRLQGLELRTPLQLAVADRDVRERNPEVALDGIDLVDVTRHRLGAAVVTAARGEECDADDSGRDKRRTIGYLTSSTTDLLPSPCWKTSFTSPFFGANHIVRVPLPKGNPFCFSFERTTSALNVPAGTFTDFTPRTVVVPVTPKIGSHGWAPSPTTSAGRRRGQ